MAQATVLLLAIATLLSPVRYIDTLPLSDSLHLWDMFNLNDTNIQQLRKTNNFIVENHINVGELLHLNATALQDALRPLYEAEENISKVDDIVPEFGEHVHQSVVQIGGPVHKTIAAIGDQLESAKLDAALHQVHGKDVVVHTAVHHKLHGSKDSMPWLEHTITWTKTK